MVSHAPSSVHVQRISIMSTDGSLWIWLVDIEAVPHMDHVSKGYGRALRLALHSVSAKECIHSSGDQGNQFLHFSTVAPMACGKWREDRDMLHGNGHLTSYDGFFATSYLAASCFSWAFEAQNAFFLILRNAIRFGALAMLGSFLYFIGGGDSWAGSYSSEARHGMRDPSSCPLKTSFLHSSSYLSWVSSFSTTSLSSMISSFDVTWKTLPPCQTQ